MIAVYYLLATCLCPYYCILISLAIIVAPALVCGAILVLVFALVFIRHKKKRFASLLIPELHTIVIHTVLLFSTDPISTNSSENHILVYVSFKLHWEMGL